MSGAKIIEGLKEAVAGDMTRVTIEGQTWLRADTLARDLQDIMRINNSMRLLLNEALRPEGTNWPNWGRRVRYVVAE